MKESHSCPYRLRQTTREAIRDCQAQWKIFKQDNDFDQLLLTDLFFIRTAVKEGCLKII